MSLFTFLTLAVGAIVAAQTVSAGALVYVAYVLWSERCVEAAAETHWPASGRGK